MTVWQALTWTDASIPEKSGDGRCSAQGVVYSGLKQTAILIVTASHVEKQLQSVVIRLNGNGNTVYSLGPWAIKPSPRKTAITQQVEAPLDQFRHYDYHVDVGIAGVSTADCREVTVDPYFRGH